MNDRTDWFLVQRTIVRPRVRLFCFPHAGGSATAFKQWSNRLPKDVEVGAVQFPGKGTRMRERPYRRMEHLIPELVKVMRPNLDAPYALFGHSLGALIAFELVRALHRADAPLPNCLFVSASPGPQVLRGLPPIHRLPQADFLRALEERYGIADPVLRDRDMADLLFPWLQADMEMLETWSYVTENRLPVRIVAYGGLEDRTISKDALVAWQEQSSLAFSCQMLRGDHFYLLHDPGPLLTSLGRVLSGTLD